MFLELSLCVNGQESEYIFDVNAYESEYSKIDKSGNIYESGKISSSVTLVLVGDLDEKVSSARYRRKRNKKKARQCEETKIYSISGLRHVQVIKSLLQILSALEASKWSQITFCILTNILNSISERFGPNF